MASFFSQRNIAIVFLPVNVLSPFFADVFVNEKGKKQGDFSIEKTYHIMYFSKPHLYREALHNIWVLGGLNVKAVGKGGSESAEADASSAIRYMDDADGFHLVHIM